MSRPRKNATQDIPLLEWVFAGIGFVLVFGTAAYIVYEGYTRGSQPPDIAVHVESVARLSNGHVVTLRATNHGDTTAADVKIEATLKSGATAVETSEVTFQYLPPRSERRGGVFFKKDPRGYELVVEPKGYEVP